MRTIVGFEKAISDLVPKHAWFNPVASESTLKFIESVFGTGVSPKQAVDLIIDRVESAGDTAVADLTLRMDGVELEELVVPKSEIMASYALVPSNVVDALNLAAEQIRIFHSQQPKSGWIDKERGVGQIINPIENVGIYVPGGRASYPSTVLMMAIPAKVAGVPSISIATPPSNNGKVPPVTLVACDIAGVDVVYRIGGPTAIAALAFGTETVSKVDKILGPGNLLVQLAKQAVYGVAGIDALQGPTETLIVADNTSNPVFCAADLLAQAEHDPEAKVILVTEDENILSKIEDEIKIQLKRLPQSSPAHISIEQNGAFVVLENQDEIVDFCNQVAPEHLCLLNNNPDAMIPKLKAAGGIFVGENSPEVLGDYTAGPSHSMPTSGAARHSSPVSVSDFMKITSLISVPKERLDEIGPAGVEIAEAENLLAHAQALKFRLDPEMRSLGNYDNEK